MERANAMKSCGLCENKPKQIQLYSSDCGSYFQLASLSSFFRLQCSFIAFSCGKRATQCASKNSSFSFFISFTSISKFHFNRNSWLLLCAQTCTQKAKRTNFKSIFCVDLTVQMRDLWTTCEFSREEKWARNVNDIYYLLFGINVYFGIY